MSNSRHDELVAVALEVREHAWAPYSKFLVGAAVLAADGSIHAGCNVENASYPLSCCAERNAVSAAIAAGQTKIIAVAVASQIDPPAAPCGACRQVLFEFSQGELELILVSTNGSRRVSRLDELLPQAFGPKDLLT